jgi:hypothetical protein
MATPSDTREELRLVIAEQILAIAKVQQLRLFEPEDEDGD